MTMMMVLMSSIPLIPVTWYFQFSLFNTKYIFRSNVNKTRIVKFLPPKSQNASVTMDLLEKTDVTVCLLNENAILVHALALSKTHILVLFWKMKFCLV